MCECLTKKGVVDIRAAWARMCQLAISDHVKFSTVHNHDYFFIFIYLIKPHITGLKETSDFKSEVLLYCKLNAVIPGIS